MSELRTPVAATTGDSEQPRVSIVVPTLNRSGKLAICLEHISAIESGILWELIVVDNGSTDETLPFLEAVTHRSPLRMRIVREPVAGGARTRNSGARVARGEILIFVDDDCYVHPDIVDRY